MNYDSQWSELDSTVKQEKSFTLQQTSAVEPPFSLDEDLSSCNIPQLDLVIQRAHLLPNQLAFSVRKINPQLHYFNQKLIRRDLFDYVMVHPESNKLDNISLRSLALCTQPAYIIDCQSLMHIYLPVTV